MEDDLAVAEPRDSRGADRLERLQQGGQVAFLLQRDGTAVGGEGNVGAGTEQALVQRARSELLVAGWEVEGEQAQEVVGEDRLNARSGGTRYRLPTEAEWEYAARAGTVGDTYAGNLTDPFGQDPALERIAWCGDNSGDRTYRVGQKAPNAWGLHEMLGNVWEWMQDWYGDYPGGSLTDPRGPGQGSFRVIRGGSWIDNARDCRAPNRDRDSPGVRYFLFGFRLLRTE